MSLKIGLLQCLAMIPGVSRSGATIIGARLLGVQRAAAAEFSFFLAVPTMVAATAYDLFKNRHDLTLAGAGLIAVRSEERRVGKEGVSTCRSRWSPDNSKKKTKI